MSYICMFANKNGVAVSGDSRLTLEPKALRLHWDRTQKVGSDPEQGLVWACCGLMIYGGVHYGRLSSRILRQSHRSLGARLNQIRAAAEKATAVRHALGGGRVTFTLLVCSVHQGAPAVQALDVVNGKSRLRTLEAPVLLQGGWDSALYQPAPPATEFADESPEQLARRARERCLWAVREDERLVRTRKRHVQTVGGNVRVAVLPARETCSAHS